MQIHPRCINGEWRYGCALDIHTIFSIPLEFGGFDTKRTEIGEALYRLKYCHDYSMLAPIAEVAAEYLIHNFRVYPSLKAIIPVPPSVLDRPFQPVIELAQAIGKKANLVVPDNYLIKIKQTQPLKAIDDVQIRHQEMTDAFDVTDQRFAGSSLLVFDDLYRSGETLNAICKTLAKRGGVQRIYTLAITMTRKKQ